MTHNVSLKCKAVLKFNFKNPRWRTTDILKIDKAISHDDAEWVRSAVRHIGFLTLIFNDIALDRHILRHFAKFRGDRSCHCGDIATFHDNFFPNEM